MISEDSQLDERLEKTYRGVCRRPPWHFDGSAAAQLLKEQYGIQGPASFGLEKMPACVSAAGCLLHYCKETQRASLKHLQAIKIEQQDDSIILDAISRRNLELEHDLTGNRDYSLLRIIDSTVTPMGSRLLRRWLNRPIRDHDSLRLRLDAVGRILADRNYLDIRESYRGISDMERILTRISLGSARPRDLIQLRSTLHELPHLKIRIEAIDSPRLQELHHTIGDFGELSQFLTIALVDNPPVTLRDGGAIAEGFDKELDDLRRLSNDASDFLLNLEIRERERTGINNLKVGYNRVHGYYIEISRLQSANVPDNYHRRQTLKASERFITEELKSFEDRVLSAQSKALAREKALYETILDHICEDLVPLQGCASALAEIDVLTSFAERADNLNFNAPVFSHEPEIQIKAGRHPVVELHQTEAFIANDLKLDQDRSMLIITGPNMGGKSTYMRQTALIVILAHIGSYVPAESACFGPIDRIFTRIGAADNLAQGQSTFMVEMTETANILNNATSNSLVLMDEIGRGTSTSDGLALAWATAVNLASSVHAYTLFATHYFELTGLPVEYDTTANVYVDAVEHGDKIIFMHAVKEGAANRSYGLQVAQLAGVPKSIIDNARQRLQEIEDQPQLLHVSAKQDDMFNQQDPALEALKKINPDEMTPKQALEMLYHLHSLIKE